MIINNRPMVSDLARQICNKCLVPIYIYYAMFSLKALLITSQSGGVIILQINLASRYYFLETGCIKKYILKNSTVSGVATKSMSPTKQCLLFRFNP